MAFNFGSWTQDSAVQKGYDFSPGPWNRAPPRLLVRSDDVVLPKDCLYADAVDSVERRTVTAVLEQVKIQSLALERGGTLIIIPDPPHHDLRLRAHAPAPRRRSPLAPQPRHNLVLLQAAVEASGIYQSLSTA